MPFSARGGRTFRKVDEIIVNKLANLLRGRDEKIVRGETKLVLTASVVNCLSRCFEAEIDVESDEIVALPSECEKFLSPELGFQENVHFLYNFMRDVATLKVTDGTGTVQGNVDVSFFKRLKILELKRIPTHLFVGLQYLRTRLEMIVCTRCLQCIEDLFVSCGGDRSAPFSWPELLCANLSYNSLETLGTSLGLLSSLVSLDVSHNNLTSTNGIEYLNKLEHLNLSYNHLKAVPRLSNLATARLKVLYISNNRLESLDGLELFSHLEVVDLAYNFLLVHCSLSPFKDLLLIKSINLYGNPISFHENHKLFSAQHLHQKCLVIGCVLDGKPLTKNDIKYFRSNRLDLRHRCWEWSTTVSPRNISEGRTIDYTVNSVRLETDIQTNDDEYGCDTVVLEKESISGIGSDQRPIKGKRKSHKNIREVVINESVPINFSAECAHVDLAEALKSSVKSDHPLETSDDHLRTKEEIEKCRKRYGKEWLIIETKLSMLQAMNRSDEIDEPWRFDISNQEKDSNVPPDSSEQTNSPSQGTDDVIVLDKETEQPFAAYVSNCQDDKDVEDSDENEDDDDDAYLLPLIVQCEKPGTDDVVTLLIIVTKTHIKEVDSLSGRTIDRLELKSIHSVETQSPKITLQDGVECSLPKILIAFNYIRQDRQRRVYIMEDDISCQQLLNVLIPVVEAKTYKEMTLGALQCLKCSAHFSKDVAKKVSKTSQQPLDDIIVLSTSSGSCKGYVTEVNICPNCGSEMVIEIDYPSSNSEAFNDRVTPTLHENIGASLKHSTSALPLHSQKLLKNLANVTMGSSCPVPCTTLPAAQTNFNTNGCRNNSPSHHSLIKFDDIERVSGRSLPFHQNCCNLVQVEVEIHNPYHFNEQYEPRISSSLKSTSGQCTDEVLKRTESDITILSNPSQSSILVVPTSIGTELEVSLDAISENSLDSHRPLSSIKRDSTKNYNVEERKCLTPSGHSKKLNSVSSESLDSACTTLEKSAGGDSRLGETPESFASALSDRGGIFFQEEKMARYTEMAKTDRQGVGESRVSEANMPTNEAECKIDHLHGTPDDDCYPGEANTTLAQVTVDSEIMNHDIGSLRWSYRNSEITYSTEDFGIVDHRLKLYLELEILEMEEDLIAVVRVGVIPYMKGEEWPGLLVVTKDNVHILKIIGPEHDQPQHWLQKLATLPIGALRFLNVRLGSQAFQLEFGPRSAPACFTLVTRDADCCNSFVAYLHEKVKAGTVDVSELQLQIGLDSDETLQTIREQLLNDDCDNDSSDRSETTEELNICLYTMGYWKPSGKAEFEAVSFVISSMELITFVEDFHWPLPHLILPSNEILSRPQLTLLDKHGIQDLTAVEQLEGNPLELILRFMDEENSQRETAWTVAMETERTLHLFVEALRKPWERMFGIQLQVKHIS